MGLVREQVLAGYEGIGPGMNAYVASFLIPEFLNHLLAGGFLSITFIPIFQKYLIVKDDEKSWRVFSNLITTGSIVLTVFIVLCMVFTRQIVGLMGQGAPPELTIRLTRIIMPAQLLFYWGAFLMAIQYANNRFFLPAMLPLCYNGGIILGGVFLHPLMGVEGFAWGVLFGSFIGNVVIQLPGAFKVGMRFRPIIDIKDPDLKLYVLLTLPLMLGLGMTFSNEVFFRFFGSFLGSGALASINYSLRTMMILVAVFGQAAGVASYPFLSRLAAEKKFDEMNAMLNSITKKIATILIPCCSVMIPLAPQIIAILYQRGHFNAQSTAATAPVLMIYLLGAFPFAASTIVMRSYYAQKQMMLPMILSTIIAVASIPLYMGLGSMLGSSGIALASIIGMTAQFCILYFMWEKRHKHVDDAIATAIFISKIASISLIGSALCIGLRWYCLAHHLFSGLVPTIIGTGLCGAPSLLVIGACIHFFRVVNLRSLLFLRKKAHIPG